MRYTFGIIYLVFAAAFAATVPRTKQAKRTLHLPEVLEETRRGPGTSLPHALPSSPQTKQEQIGEAPVLIEVFPSILVSNTLGLDSIALSFGSIRNALNLAFVALVEEVLDNIATADPIDNLSVSLVPHNTRLGYLYDRNCPISIYAYHVSSCQVGTGVFLLSVSGENNADQIQEQIQGLEAWVRYEQAIDDAIASGRFQQLLEEVDPSTPLRVYPFSLHATEGTIVPGMYGEEGFSSNSRSAFAVSISFVVAAVLGMALAMV